MLAPTISSGLEGAYATKEQGYFSGARRDFIESLPHNPRARILEVGCGSGETGALALEGGYAGYYAGVELMPEPAAIAAQRLSEVRVGNVETLEFDWQPNSFDALILSEVLEHLVEPESVLRRLAPLVRAGGVVLASSPNVSHWRVLRELMAGRFPQEDKGVFDRTHLRWFTPQTFAAMFEKAGFEVKSTGPVTPLSARTRTLSRLTGGRLDHLFMTQISLKAVRR